ncbi:hypothetical protein ES703_79877 [subsurface metagenome]
MEPSKTRSSKHIQFFINEHEKNLEINLSSKLTISDVELFVNEQFYNNTFPIKEILIFSGEKQRILKNDMILENIWNKDLFFVSLKSNYNKDAIKKFESLRSRRKKEIDRIVNIPTTQLKVAWLLFNQGTSIENSLQIAQMFYIDKSWINEIIEDNNIKVDDLLEDYQFLSGYVLYYDGGGEYRPIEKNPQEQAFYDFFRRFNYMEKRVELEGDNMILLYCIYSEC